MKLAVRYAGLSDRGRVRRTNQDNWAADPEQGLFIVADGMGGEFAGTLASKVVVATLPELVRKYFAPLEGLPNGMARRWMRKALATLSTQLRDQTHDEPGLDGMGSTVVCALVRGNKALVAHMGDSRAYLLRAGRLKQLTEDHTLIQLLLRSGDVTAREGASHPARGRLTRSVGMEGEPLPQTRLLRLISGDLLMLCTDGLTGMLSDDQILSILDKPATLETQCRRLVDAANAAGGKDNVTVLLVRFAREKEKPASTRRRAESTTISVSSGMNRARATMKGRRCYWPAKPRSTPPTARERLCIMRRLVATTPWQNCFASTAVTNDT